MRALTSSLLDASTLCAIATVSLRGRAYVNTAYFAWSDRFDLVWLSEARATHSRNLRTNAAAAIAVFDSTQRWGERDRGIQLFGSARMVAGRAAREAARVYAERFPKYGETQLGAYDLYRFRPSRVKLFDERVLGSGVFVTARVRGGQVTWERTDVYDSAD